MAVSSCAASSRRRPFSPTQGDGERRSQCRCHQPDRTRPAPFADVPARPGSGWRSGYRSCRVGACHVGACHVGACHVGACHVGVCHVGACHVGACHVGACHVGRPRRPVHPYSGPRHTDVAARSRAAAHCPSTASTASSAAGPAGQIDRRRGSAGRRRDVPLGRYRRPDRHVVVLPDILGAVIRSRSAGPASRWVPRRD